MEQLTDGVAMVWTLAILLSCVPFALLTFGSSLLLLIGVLDRRDLPTPIGEAEPERVPPPMGVPA